jgi:hypothetical protein
MTVICQDNITKGESTDTPEDLAMITLVVNSQLLQQCTPTSGGSPNPVV